MTAISIIIVIVVDFFIIRSTVKEYHKMQTAKRKAQMWNANIK